MDKIFESKGCPKKQSLFLLSCGIILVIGGIFFLLLSNAKHKERAILTRNAYGTLISSSTIGGGYVLNEDGRKMFMILGFIVLVLGISAICSLRVLKKSVFTVYEGYIEGVQYVPLFIVNLKSEFHLEYNQIVDVQVSQGIYGQMLKIVAKGGNYMVTLKEDGEKGIAYIRREIKNVSEV